MIGGIPWEEFTAPILLSLRVTMTASVIVFAAALFAAWTLGRRTYRFKTIVETVFLLPLVLPPTVVGFVLLALLGRRSWIGRAIEAVFQAPIVFTWWAAVVASVVVAFPLAYQTMKVGFGSVDRSLEEAARTDGAGERQVLLRITLPLAARSLLTAYVLGFARSLGEFGATLMIAGNIPGRTETVPTAIYTAVESGRWAPAWWWAGAIAALSFVLMLVAGRTPKAQ
ncbi:molybdenum ABC transporter permease [Gordoniibacillus kamchatkensis]|uniref:Molybdenum transport system permease n=1 Tax=Gordoniibacillus kamchatkensis TaxID=1590651 RepID=A0ABR5AAD4_9BACL|nr:molybdate ABC transporter permease subunit [Paenibacillus sp. VKM B-2647]KIL37793.1 molybdenum ABC transporter permease [Paenibacillus sp. VKM B-2647]